MSTSYAAFDAGIASVNHKEVRSFLSDVNAVLSTLYLTPLWENLPNVVEYLMGLC